MAFPLRVIPLLIGVLLSRSALLEAQVLTAPLAPHTFPAGDDFFTDELMLPADGTNRRMMGWEENFIDVHVSDGLWHGTYGGPDAYVFPLYGGLAGTLLSDSLQTDSTLPKFGIKNRIDSNKYYRLAYRLRVGGNSFGLVYWEANDSKPGGYWPDPTSPACNVGERVKRSFGDYSPSSFLVYDVNLKDLSYFSCPGGSRGQWSGNVHSLRIDPAVYASQGTKASFDWIRLVDPNSAPPLTISWQRTGQLTGYYYRLMLDSDNVGYDGSQFYATHSFQSSESYTFPSAILPPGTHYFYVEKLDYIGDTSPERSAYSAPIAILAKTHLAITAPAANSGEDYATFERGNPWDMDSGNSDIVNNNTSIDQHFKQFITPSFPESPFSTDGGNVFQAQAEPPYFHRNASESDVQLVMSVDKLRPIDPNHYRYIFYRMAIGEYGYPTISDKVRQGWVSRVIGWNKNLLVDGTHTKPQIIYEGWHDYWFDLSDSFNIDSGVPWTTFRRVPNIRLDPGEFTIPGFTTWFYVDFIRLHGENRTKNRKYDVRFILKDEDSSRFNVEIYYDTDNVGYNGTLLAKLENLGPGEHSYLWDTTSLPNLTPYWIYLVVSDGTNLSRRYSSVHLRTGDYLGGSRGKTEFDYDGDGQSDQTVYRISSSRRRRKLRTTGTFYYNRSSLQYSTQKMGDNTNYRPIYGDFDGDGRTDSGISIVVNGQMQHVIRRSSDDTVYSRSWGLAGDVLAIADYDSNGADDICVYRNGSWFVLHFDGRVNIYHWGYPGDVPVPADYNGDRVVDIAIWRPGDGTWWVLNSGARPTGYTEQQWGLPGDIPLAADWNGDGNADFLVYRPAEGNWYLYDKNSGLGTVTQWGLPGDIPRIGDFNGDGILDFTVYRQGLWFHNFRSGQIGVIGFGLPGDFLPIKGGSL